VALAAPGCAGAAAAGPTAAAAPAGTCFLDKQGRGGGGSTQMHQSGVAVCHTAAEHNANARTAILSVAAFFSAFLWVGVFQLRRGAEVRDVFVRHAAALRARAAGVASGSSERAALEAEAADVEAAAADWPRIMKDELVLASPTKVVSSFFTNTGGNKKNAYTVQQKEEAAGERSALLSKHSFTAFDGVRESAKRGPECIRDGLFLVPVAVLILGGMAYAAQVVQCEAPLYRMCLTAVAPTYTCGFGPDGTCVATPIAA
jgi:hypothetical protein